MKNINVRIIDENTLELAENGTQGDRINLKALHEIDIDKSPISSAISKKIEAERKSAAEQERERVSKEKDKDLEIALAAQKTELKDKYKEESRGLEKEVTKLLAEKQSIEKEQEAKVKIALMQKEKEHNAQKSKLEHDLELERFKTKNIEDAKNQEIESLKDKNELELKNRDDFSKQQIESLERERDRWKDYQHSLSIKDFGNKLEEYCDKEFDSMTWLPKGTTFEPDTIGETKGDRIYREKDSSGNEVLTIMFEIKNERDDTKDKDKQTNKKFFSKLDKDRKNKKCEYAVLVSLLEADNKNYDAPFTVREYEKMVVIRPQWFQYIINNFRSLKSELAHTNMQLTEVKKKHIDVVKFQENWSEFLEGFGKNVNSAAVHFRKLRENKVKQIDLIQKEIEELDLVGKNLDLAFRKGEKVDFQKIAKDSPTLLLQLQFSEE